MPSEMPVEVSLHLRLQNGYGQWGIAVLEEGGALTVRTGEVEPLGTARATRAEAAVAAFGAVLEAAAGRPYVVLDVAPGRLRLAIAKLVGSVPGVVLAEPSWEAPEHRAALVEAVKAMPEHVPVKTREGAVSMVVSTDASVNSRGCVAGLGFVIAAEDGTVLSVGHRTEQLARKGDILAGELLAVLWAIKSMISRHPVPLPGQGTVTVQSDSKAALGLLETVRAGRTPAGGTTAHVEVAERILAVSARMPVQFRWVRGHAGHEGNEAADRLAVLARRGEEFKVPKETRVRMFGDLRDDLVGKAAA